MRKKLIKFLYLLIIVIEVIIMKIYNETYQLKQNIEIEKQSISYILNKQINPNIKDDNQELKQKIIEYEIVLEIPKINLKKGILKKEDKNNNIEENVTILQESQYPNEDGNIYLAAHSGNGNKSYFNRLTELTLYDNVFLYYQNTKYIYHLIESREVSKNTQLTIQTETSNNLILITCSQKDKSKYLILIFNKQKETELSNN